MKVPDPGPPIERESVNIPEPEHGYCHLVAGAATQPNLETPAWTPERVLFSFLLAFTLKSHCLEIGFDAW